ncbi:hypothetical protein EVAR_58955_1 [Eumeta japonica]|uniref:Uncharacterized protein n=1 Tax=Eumeta variegata TaxID=151549 RepID=A0A4C1YJ82_EUMVA|nr:hypothetical protein EVAR_58955_1 [Eumeta japonica]
MYDMIKTLNKDLSNSDIFMANASTLDSLHSNFVSTIDERNEFLASNPDAAEPTYDNLLAFEELYCIVWHKYEEILSQKNLQETKYSHTATRQTHKLPPLELKSFDDTVLAGIGDVTSSIEGVTCLTIRSRYDDSVRFTIQPLIVNCITNALPTANINHMLLGSDLFARILRHKTVSRGTTEPVAVETLLEEVPDVSLLTPEENECELIYSSTVKHESSGRYVTVIPFQGDPNTLVKFSSNSPRVLKNIPHNHRVPEVIEFDSNDNFKILGVNWHPIAELAAIKALQAISFTRDLKRIRTGKIVSPALQSTDAQSYSKPRWPPRVKTSHRRVSSCLYHPFDLPLCEVSRIGERDNSDQELAHTA